jgi:hypothetical protein
MGTTIAELQDWLLAHPLFLIALSSLGFATQALFVKLIVMQGEVRFEAGWGSRTRVMRGRSSSAPLKW